MPALLPRLLRTRFGRTKRTRLSVLLICAAAAPGGAAAQSSALVSPDDHMVRADLSLLASSGLTDRITSGLGALSRLEAARVLRDALSSPLATSAAASTVSAIRRLEEHFAPELAVLADQADSGAVTPSRPLAYIEARAAYLDAPSHGYPNNFLGDIDARANPLGSLRQGRTWFDGANGTLETAHTIQLGPRATVHARPRLRSWVAPGTEEVEESVSLQEAYVRIPVRSLAVTVGRADVVWGQSRRGSLIMSGNARSPWLARLTTDRPVVLPGFLDALGPVTGDLFAADLGGGQNFPNAKLTGYHVSIRPHPRFEAGLGIISHFGGEGAPEYSFGGVVKDLLFVLKGVRQFSNKLAGVDFRWWFPDTGGLSIYGEFVADDIDLNPGRLPEWILEDVGHVYGIEVARLTRDGRLGGWAEVHHTGHRFYRHSQFTSGTTYQGDILGNPLGPDGDGLYGGLDLRSTGGDLLRMEAAWERQSRDRYYVLGDPLFNTFPGDDGWSVYEDFPEETRVRILASWHREAPSHGAGFSVRTGLQRTANFDYTAGADRTDFLTELRVRFRLR